MKGHSSKQQNHHDMVQHPYDLLRGCLQAKGTHRRGLFPAVLANLPRREEHIAQNDPVVYTFYAQMYIMLLLEVQALQYDRLAVSFVGANL